jgi:hypothetical protein
VVIGMYKIPQGSNLEAAMAALLYTVQVKRCTVLYCVLYWCSIVQIIPIRVLNPQSRGVLYSQ